MDNMKPFQNCSIACISELANTDSIIVYISPVAVGPTEVAYFERFLNTLGISTLPHRLHFIVPEMVHLLPPHMPLAMVLYYSTGALRKIK